MASAAQAAPATQTASHFQHCNPWAHEHWNLKGANHVKAVYLGQTRFELFEPTRDEARLSPDQA